MTDELIRKTYDVLSNVHDNAKNAVIDFVSGVCMHARNSMANEDSQPVPTNKYVYNPDGSTTVKIKYIFNTIIGMCTILQYAPMTTEEIVVWRAARLNNFKKGSYVDHMTPVSTAIDNKFALTWMLTRNNYSCCLLKIIVPPGTKILAIGSYLDREHPCPTRKSKAFDTPHPYAKDGKYTAENQYEAILGPCKLVVKDVETIDVRPEDVRITAASAPRRALKPALATLEKAGHKINVYVCELQPLTVFASATNNQYRLTSTPEKGSLRIYNGKRKAEPWETVRSPEAVPDNALITADMISERIEKLAYEFGIKQKPVEQSYFYSLLYTIFPDAKNWKWGSSDSDKSSYNKISRSRSQSRSPQHTLAQKSRSPPVGSRLT
jgi:hypothetical protein